MVLGEGHADCTDRRNREENIRLTGRALRSCLSKGVRAAALISGCIRNAAHKQQEQMKSLPGDNHKSMSPGILQTGNFVLPRRELKRNERNVISHGKRDKLH